MTTVGELRKLLGGFDDATEVRISGFAISNISLEPEVEGLLGYLDIVGQ